MSYNSPNDPLLTLHSKTTDQTNQLRQIARTADQSNETQNNIMASLDEQRGLISRGINQTKEIDNDLNRGRQLTNQMRRRNMCIKGGLWLVIIVLFVTFIIILITKIKKN